MLAETIVLSREDNMKPSKMDRRMMPFFCLLTVITLHETTSAAIRIFLPPVLYSEVLPQ